MEARLKAIELYNKFLNSSGDSYLYGMLEHESAIECALIAVDELIKSDPISPNDVDWDDAGGTHLYYHLAQRGEALEFWEQVKEEILKL